MYTLNHKPTRCSLSQTHTGQAMSGPQVRSHLTVLVPPWVSWALRSPHPSHLQILLQQPVDGRLPGSSKSAHSHGSQPRTRGNSYPTCSAATLSRRRKKSTSSPLLMPTPAFTFSKSLEIPGCKMAVFFRPLPKPTSSYFTTVQRLVIYKMYFVQHL